MYRAYGKLNILINNAGYTWDGMAHKISDEQWDAMLKVHNTAPFRLIRAGTVHSSPTIAIPVYSFIHSFASAWLVSSRTIHA